MIREGPRRGTSRSSPQPCLGPRATAGRTEPQRLPAQDGRRVLDVFPEHDSTVLV